MLMITTAMMKSTTSLVNGVAFTVPEFPLSVEKGSVMSYLFIQGKLLHFY